MADTIEKGITITFRGETTEFDKGVSKIDGELKGLKSELSLLNRELKLDPTNFDKLSKKMDALKEREKLLTEELEAYNEAMSQMDKTSDEFKNAEEKARNLRIEIGYVNKAIEQMGGNKVSLALNTLGKGFNDLGNKFTEVGKKLAPLSAIAGGLLGGFAKLSYKVVQSADDLNTLSKQTGLSTETLQVFGQMADLIDVDLDTLSKSATKLTKNLDTTKSQEAFKKLGISVYDASGKYKSSEALFFETLEALQQLDDETERSIIANDLFGNSYVELGSIINDATLDLGALNDEVKENGAILSQDELNSLNAVNDNIDKFKQIIAGVGTTLVSEFSEPIKNITEVAINLANKIKEFIGRLSGEQKQKIVTILGILALVVPALLLIGSTLGALGTIFTTMSTIVSVASTVWSFFNAVLTANPIGAIIMAIVALIAIIVLVVKNFDTIKAKVQEVWEKFKQTEFVQNLIAIFEKLKAVLDKVVGAIKSVFEWISKTIGKVGEFFKSGIDTIVGWFSSGGFGNKGIYASGGYGSLELNTTINVNNNGVDMSKFQAQQFGRQIVDYVNDKLGRRI